VGYRGVPLPGLPYDERKGILPNKAGRVLDPKSGGPLPGLYAVGWAKRGPTGVIGTNKPDAAETVKNLLEDFAQGNARPVPEPDELTDFLKKKGVRFVRFADWKVLDRLEAGRGRLKGKIREKFTQVSDMLSALEGASV
jgi:ferredoxin--NADP+ reductase